MNNVYLGIGGNLGNPVENINSALIMLGDSCCVVAVSKFYTSPLLKLDGTADLEAPVYYNVCCFVATNLQEFELLDEINNIENRLGRVRDNQNKNSSRTLDIDILFFNDLVLNTENLQIPHPRLYERDFVLVPLCEIAKDFVCPLTGRSCRVLLECVSKLK